MALTVDHGILSLSNQVENSDTTSNEGGSRTKNRSRPLAQTEHVEVLNNYNKREKKNNPSSGTFFLDMLSPLLLEQGHTHVHTYTLHKILSNLFTAPIFFLFFCRFFLGRLLKWCAGREELLRIKDDVGSQQIASG